MEITEIIKEKAINKLNESLGEFSLAVKVEQDMCLLVETDINKQSLWMIEFITASTPAEYKPNVAYVMIADEDGDNCFVYDRNLISYIYSRNK